MTEVEAIRAYETYKGFLERYGFNLHTEYVAVDDTSCFKVSYLNRETTWSCRFYSIEEISAFTTGILQYKKVEERQYD